MNIAGNGALGASMLVGILLSAILLGKVLAPVIAIVGLFVGLPWFWVSVVSKTTEDPFVRSLLMAAAAAVVLAVAWAF